MKQHATLSTYPQRNSRRYRFTIPNAVWEYSLRPIEFLLLSFLCCHQSKVLDTDAIASGVHLSTGTVKKYLASLQTKGLVTDALSRPFNVQMAKTISHSPTRSSC